MGETNTLRDGLLGEIQRIRGTGSSSPNKYDRLKEVLKELTGATTAVCFISDLSKEWTPRLGQALMGLPRGIIVLSAESFTGKRSGYKAKLVELVKFIPQIEFAIVFVGAEGSWQPELIAGPEDSEIAKAFTSAFPAIRASLVSIPRLTYLPFPPS